jgi:hypothetical protein
MNYDDRINILDSFLEFIVSLGFPNGIGTDTGVNLENNTNNDMKKFYLLCFIHYVVLSQIFLIFFFTKNVYLFSICLLCILIQIAVNLLDNGCFLLKLERKYIGKWWFGTYTVLKYIHPSLLNNGMISNIYYSFMIGIVFIGIYRIFTDFNAYNYKK